MPTAHRSTVHAARAIALGIFTLLIAASMSGSRAAAYAPQPTTMHNSVTSAPPACASTFTLYDGALGGTPDTQGMAFLTPSVSATQTFSNGVTILDTTLKQGDLAGYFGDHAGYFGNSVDVPVLDRT